MPFIEDDPSDWVDPFWAADHKAPHHVDGEEGGEGEHRGGGDGGGGRGEFAGRDR